MKQTLTTSQAAHMLIDDSNANWSRAGAFALIEYLEEMEVDCMEEMEFCHVAIRCDWSEYDSLHDWAVDYFINWRSDLSIDADAEEDAIEEVIREYIRDHGILIGFDGGIIVSSF
jgi:hypothetical protein